MTLHNFSSVENLMHAIRLFFILERFDIVRPVFSESSFNVIPLCLKTTSSLIFIEHMIISINQLM